MIAARAIDRGRGTAPNAVRSAFQRSRATALVNARVGYRFENGIRAQIDAFNLFNTKASQIDYFYASRLPSEPAGGVEDRHFHPVEPLAVRFTLAASL